LRVQPIDAISKLASNSSYSSIDQRFFAFRE
jgi:hypothetical protein